jgi:four helix bundle protein
MNQIPKSEASVANARAASRSEKVYDLRERSARFGEAAIRFARGLPKDVLVLPLTGQFVRSATSVGANLAEADGAESKKDHKHRIAICKREANETAQWLRMIAAAVPDNAGECRRLWQEAHELTLILATIYRLKDE